MTLAGTLALTSLALAAPSPAMADPTPAACAEAYVEGQHLLRDHHLRRAREDLLICARAPCPRTLQPECTQWLTDVDRAIPTVVLDVRGTDGAPLRGVRLTVDGEGPLDTRGGTAREIEPGDHVARAEAEGRAPVVEPFVAREGEKNRLVVLTLPASAAMPIGAPLATVGTSPAATDGEGHAPSYLPTFVAGGAAVAGLAVFAGFAIGALDVHSALTSEACSPRCASSRVDTGRTDEIVADVGLGAAVVSLGLATYFFLHARSRAPLATTPATSAASPLRLGVAF